MHKLSYILNNIMNFKWSDALFLPEDEVWNKDTKGMVLDPDDVEDDEDEVPKEAKKKQLMYALNIQTVQAIVKNVEQQNHYFTDDDLVEAFLYYYDNDAYIEIKNG